MSSISTPTRRRRAHRQPVCESSGKRRFRDGKDARLALRDAARIRANAERDGAACSWYVTRAWRCDDCGGYHLAGPATVLTTVGAS